VALHKLVLGSNGFDRWNILIRKRMPPFHTRVFKSTGEAETFLITIHIQYPSTRLMTLSTLFPTSVTTDVVVSSLELLLFQTFYIHPQRNGCTELALRPCAKSWA
jgi:hypothetical protein